MLARLEHALDCHGLAKQMVLQPKTPSLLPPPTQEINLVVGYNGSVYSQTALDLTLWIAHQTRLVTRKAVTVQVVYVVELERAPVTVPDNLSELSFCPIDVYPDLSRIQVAADDRSPFAENSTHSELVHQASLTAICDRAVRSDLQREQSSDWQIQQFEKADRILWQARNLANEWRGSLETHLRFGCVAEELRTVAQQVSTTALFLGCSSVQHPIVQGLGQELLFPVLGIPSKLSPR
ncbi:MAG: universal stress protein [Oscillatoriales cyanobacterium C42_A2020_001]|nr:universal stress protein [Leptolyngbyaceae cyanobacterium C42_A2020_001]